MKLEQVLSKLQIDLVQAKALKSLAIKNIIDMAHNLEERNNNDQEFFDDLEYLKDNILALENSVNKVETLLQTLNHLA